MSSWWASLATRCEYTRSIIARDVRPRMSRTWTGLTLRRSRFVGSDCLNRCGWMPFSMPAFRPGIRSVLCRLDSAIRW
jgi:hypothetical protein